jgi:hypothetical protein
MGYRDGTYDAPVERFELAATTGPPRRASAGTRVLGSRRLYDRRCVSVECRNPDRSWVVAAGSRDGQVARQARAAGLSVSNVTQVALRRELGARNTSEWLSRLARLPTLKVAHE